MIQVGIISFIFAIEMINVLEYIEGTRLSMVRFDQVVATFLVFMCLSRLGLLYFRWMFFVHQWTDRVEQFKNEITLDTNSDQTLRGMSIILTILMHDCVYKFLKIFYFSRFKPAGLQMTTAQLLQPILDVLLVVISFVAIAKELYNMTFTRKDLKAKLNFLRYTPLYNAVYPFCMRNRERAGFSIVTETFFNKFMLLFLIYFSIFYFYDIIKSSCLDLFEDKYSAIVVVCMRIMFKKSKSPFGYYFF